MGKLWELPGGKEKVSSGAGGRDAEAAPGISGVGKLPSGNEAVPTVLRVS